MQWITEPALLVEDGATVGFQSAAAEKLVEAAEPAESAGLQDLRCAGSPGLARGRANKLEIT